MNKLPAAETAPEKFRFLCFGVGAIGTYIGGSLVLSGQEVVFLDRPQVAQMIRADGLRLKIGKNERWVTQPEVVSTIAEALDTGSFDAAILAVKAFDTRPLLESLVPYATRLPPFLCLQNGVENEALVASFLGQGKVITGTITTAIRRRGVGNINLERLRGVGIALDHPLAHPLIQVLNSAGLNSRGYPNAASLKWSKMLTNLLANASSAILDMTPAQIFSDAALCRVEFRMVREALAVMAANHIPVTDLPSTPVRLLAWAIRYLPEYLSQPLSYQALGRGRGAKMPSFHIDLYAGHAKSEVDYLNGAVVRFGKQAGVAVPVNQWLNETLLKLAAGELPRETYARQPLKFLADLNKKC